MRIRCRTSRLTGLLGQQHHARRDCIPARYVRTFTKVLKSPHSSLSYYSVSLTVFCILVGEYLVRRVQDRPLRKATMKDSDSAQTLIGGYRGPIGKPMQLLALGLCIEAFFLYIRFVQILSTSGFFG